MELGERYKLSFAHLSCGRLYESALFGGEYVVGINHAFGLDERAILPLSESYKIPRLDMEAFEHLAGNDHLAPLAHAANPLPGSG